MKGRNKSPRRSVLSLGKQTARGFSLLELLAVITLMGVLAAVGVSRMDRGTLLNVGAQGDARRIAIDLHQARRRAISTGDNHFVRFSLTGGHATSFVVHRRTISGSTVVEAVRTVPDDVVVVPNAIDNEFTFDGTSLAAYSIVVTGGSKSWTVTVVPATGTTRVVQND
jgi:prepilin-type N-terminal cleavage/methylation domain-containing protein